MNKVVFYVEFFITGGRERFILNVRDGLKKLGFSTDIVLDINVNEWKTEIPLVLSDKYSSFLGRSFLLRDIVAESDAFVSNLGLYPYNFDIGTYAKTHEFAAMIYFPNKFLTVCHNGDVSYYISTNKKLSHYLNSNTRGIISICNEMQRVINLDYGINNVRTIYNSTDIATIHTKMREPFDREVNYKYILAVGRLAEQKNFCSLVKAYYNSKLKDYNIKLVILGEGHENDMIVQLAKDLNISDFVVLIGKVDNPFNYMKNALFMVMSSRHEGFPLVLGECLATGTPIISYDLKTGPNEIIIHEFNGLLVKDQDEVELTKAIDRLYFDEVLYEKCKSNALQSVMKFDSEIIIQEWKTLIDEIIKENKQNSTKLRINDPDYVNIHGNFTVREFLDYAFYFINYDKILEYINEIGENSSIAFEFEQNIYDFVDRYCIVFKCTQDVKRIILAYVAIWVKSAIINSSLPDYTKTILLANIKLTNEVYINNSALIYMLSKKDDEIYGVINDRWYKFGRLSKFKKLKKIVKLSSTKFLPIGSIRRDFAKLTYKIAKLFYKNIIFFTRLFSKKYNN